MRKVFVYSLLLLMAASCADSGKGVISLSVAGAADSCEVVVSRLAVNTIIPTDTIYIQGQKSEFSMKCTPQSPEFIYLNIPDKTPISLVLLPGDKIKVDVAEDNSVSIRGSEESLKMQAVEQDIRTFQSKFDNLSAQMVAAANSFDMEIENRLRKEISSLYISRKKDAIKYIYKNPTSITTIPVIYQKVSSSLPIFAQTSDMMILKKVYDTLQPIYPSSPFIAALADDIEAKTNALALQRKLDNVVEVDFPDISLPDINSQEKSLSDYKGKVIVLLFWTSTQENQMMYNAELKQLYDRYSYIGLEIYQVALDADKTSWATQVRDQQIPWVSVCDINAGASVSAMLYNVTKLPSMFIISKDGQIVDKDVFDTEKLETLLVKEIKK